MYGFFRHLRELIRRAQATPAPVSPNMTDRNLELIQKAEAALNRVQSLLEKKFQPLLARTVIINTTHANIEELTKYLVLLNRKLSDPKYYLDTDDVVSRVNSISLDSFFVSTDGHYISQATIEKLVRESYALLEHATPLAQVEVGEEEYRYRLLQSTIISLFSVHHGLAVVLGSE